MRDAAGGHDRCKEHGDKGERRLPRCGLVIRTQMPYFLIQVRGNADQAAGLLARAGIQSLTSHLSGTGRRSLPASEQGATARLLAENAAEARQRVRTALAEGSFAVERVMRAD